MFQNLDYNKPYLLSVHVNQNGYLEKTYLSRHHIKTTTDEYDNYYLKVYLVDANGTEIQEGYLYFTINFMTNLNSFIGMYINPQFRNTGLASFLTATWIDLSLEDGLNLAVNKRQKKPFLLYILKKFAFEIDDISLYETRKSVIYICQKNNSLEKALFFRNPYQKEEFKNSRARKNDNYVILNSLDDDTTVLDQIILTDNYSLHKEDKDKSYRKVLDVFKRKQN